MKKDVFEKKAAELIFEHIVKVKELIDDYDSDNELKFSLLYQIMINTVIKTVEVTSNDNSPTESNVMNIFEMFELLAEISAKHARKQFSKEKLTNKKGTIQ